ncbi:MAG: DUF2313 domain-containing protein [Lachnospiraceae bacterium]|nr:DUF2313 domain-containing protein [Lachnospiraceae bacterium]
MSKIIDHIPYELQDVVDYQQISLAIESYLATIENKLDRLNDNLNILTADEDTIKMLEELLEIIPPSGASLEERRKAVWTKALTKIPYTEQWLRHWLKNITNDNYIIVFNYANYSFNVIITINSPYIFDCVVRTLDIIVPAHINFIISYGTFIETKCNEYYALGQSAAVIYNLKTVYMP